jgi:hypothetical protein
MRIHAGDVSILSRSLSLLQHLTPDITPESMRKGTCAVAVRARVFSGVH